MGSVPLMKVSAYEEVWQLGLKAHTKAQCWHAGSCPAHQRAVKGEASAITHNHTDPISHQQTAVPRDPLRVSTIRAVLLHGSLQSWHEKAVQTRITHTIGTAKNHTKTHLNCSIICGVIGSRNVGGRPILPLLWYLPETYEKICCPDTAVDTHLCHLVAMLIWSVGEVEGGWIYYRFLWRGQGASPGWQADCNKAEVWFSEGFIAEDGYCIIWNDALPPDKSAAGQNNHRKIWLG